VKMATSAQVIRSPPNAHTARCHFGNAYSQLARQNALRSGAGTAIALQHRGSAVITAARESNRQGLEERRVSLFNPVKLPKNCSSYSVVDDKDDMHR